MNKTYNCILKSSIDARPTITNEHQMLFVWGRGSEDERNVCVCVCVCGKRGEEGGELEGGEDLRDPIYGH